MYHHFLAMAGFVFKLGVIAAVIWCSKKSAAALVEPVMAPVEMIVEMVPLEEDELPL
jgi:hypothetical protein